MTGKRKGYGTDFKAKVALETLPGELTAAQLAAKYGVHQTMVHDWKQQAQNGFASLFSGRTEAKDSAPEGELHRLHAKIGQLVAEQDFQANASGR
jgi:transposase